MAPRKNYIGTERRVHHVFVTRNTEYHVRHGVCVGVKARNSTDWLSEHGALQMRVEGHVKVGTLLPVPGGPKLGCRIYFADHDNDILTSPVIAVIRPAKGVVDQYPQDTI